MVFIRVTDTIFSELHERRSCNSSRMTLVFCANAKEDPVSKSVHQE